MPASALGKRGAFLGHVAANVHLGDEQYRLTILLPRFPQSRPGQFVQVLCRPPGEQAGAQEVEWPAGRWPKATQVELVDRQPLLRRPLSLAGRRDRRDGGAEIDLIYRAVGTGTHWLARAQPGDALSVLGPLGNAFALRPGKGRAALVGGGVGIPPMLYLAEALADAGKSVMAFCGVATAQALPVTLKAGVPVSPATAPTPCVDEFPAACGCVIATDDGSLGFAGFVSEAFRRWLEAEAPAADEMVVYSCGPEAMMRTVGDLCVERDIECQLALERHMACGMGTCQSCVVKIRDGGAPGRRGWSYKLCCADGPVFDARDVVWK